MNSTKTVLYLDDGFGMVEPYDACKQDSYFVRNSFAEAGFLPDTHKSIFSYILKLEWLSIVWNSSEFSLSIPVRRITDLFNGTGNI